MAGEDETKERSRWRQKRWSVPAVVLGLVGVVGLLAVITLAPPHLIQMRQPNTNGLSAGDRAKIEAQFETDRTNAENALRGTLVTMLAGLAVAAGTVVAGLNLLETQRQNRRSSELQQRGQVTERFGKAIDQLGQSGPEKLDVRIGGVYALEQIARDTREDKAGDLHWPIVEILIAFIREHTKAESDVDSATAGGDMQAGSKPVASGEVKPSQRVVAADIQAALIVLRRRQSDRDRGYLNLGRAQLQGADLREATSGARTSPGPTSGTRTSSGPTSWARPSARPTSRARTSPARASSSSAA